MARFALIVAGAFREVRNYEEQPDDIPHKDVQWLPVVEQTVDNSTGPDTVSIVAAPVVEATRVVITTTVRNMTAQEIADGKDRELDAMKGLKVLATALWHTNKGTVPAAALTSPANFRTWLRSLFDGA